MSMLLARVKLPMLDVRAFLEKRKPFFNQAWGAAWFRLLRGGSA
jgi:hypothetical protein